MYKVQYSDLEAGSAVALYPGISYSENIDRWNFIRKIYGILSLQLLLTVAVAGLVLYNPSVALFFNSSSGFGLYILLVISPFISARLDAFHKEFRIVPYYEVALYYYKTSAICKPIHRALDIMDCKGIESFFLFKMPKCLKLEGICALYYFHQTHPINYILLFAFTACISLAVGLSCSFTDGRVIFEAAILTAAVVLSLTLYTLWAARRGYDFNFLGPILFSTLIALIVFGFIQVLFPLGRTSVMIYGVLASIIFSGYIVFDTDNLIKRYSYDEYIWATVALYLDIINLFLSLLTLFRATRD